MYSRRVFSVSYSALKVSDLILICVRSFPSGSDGKESACSAGDLGLISGSVRSSAEGNGYPLWYSGLENPMDGGAWWATVQEIAKSWTRLSNFTFTFTLLLGRKAMTNLDSVLKSTDITWPTKVRLLKAMVFPGVTYGSESWTIKKVKVKLFSRV